MLLFNYISIPANIYTVPWRNFWFDSLLIPTFVFAVIAYGLMRVIAWRFFRVNPNVPVEILQSNAYKFSYASMIVVFIFYFFWWLYLSSNVAPFVNGTDNPTQPPQASATRWRAAWQFIDIIWIYGLITAIPGTLPKYMKYRSIGRQLLYKWTKR